MKILVRPQKTPLTGTITVPGDKSISHRAVMLAAIANGRSHIRNWLPAGDTLATLAGIQSLGIQIEIDKKSPQAWDLQIEGKGLYGLQAPSSPLDCRNAGTFMRLMAGILAGQSFPSVLDGSGQLRKRPMRRIIDPLQQMGANITAQDGKAPLSIQPAELQGFEYQMTIASAQVKSAVLLAGLYARGMTCIVEAGPSRDHTERMLAAMNADIIWRDGVVELNGGRELWPLDLTVPGDISSAAFPMVAAAIVPHSQITIQNVGLNETRTGLLDMLRMMGASFTIENERTTGGEPAADLTVRFDELHAADISGEVVVRGIDEFPILTVAATQAAGETTVHDAAELRVKEVDRIGVLAAELRKMAVTMTEHPDGFTIVGPLRPYSAEVDSHDDHRLGMALAVAGLVTHGETMIHDAGCVSDSFPGFVETMQALGARMEWVE
ncbi:MAG: 3-phosphoshikimate 1-carboxyvinyltransferase [Ardenticatenaceae bacterium]|nr:3-phosphoshikimate 1-carboxyvinyltransferase [Ardenticatenaceae bacterium]MCB9442865.1 3-phosphoshikimate 1-carboxyvinyltransferase [Ardenticatenaceae bacterium]